ncbi:MAG: hypothetical protein MK212_00105 [Saprospiraceae bacterium]|nr:hypothetical protein [Saprospiraceae bacterium]
MNFRRVIAHPFGWVMPDQNYASTENRFGFQAQEEDSELWEGVTNYKYRMHNPRVGRFFSVDPLDSKYPYYSPYAFSENRLIDGIELEGLEYTDLDGTSGTDIESSGNIYISYANTIKNVEEEQRKNAEADRKQAEYDAMTATYKLAAPLEPKCGAGPLEWVWGSPATKGTKFFSWVARASSTSKVGTVGSLMNKITSPLKSGDFWARASLGAIVNGLSQGSMHYQHALRDGHSFSESFYYAFKRIDLVDVGVYGLANGYTGASELSYGWILGISVTSASTIDGNLESGFSTAFTGKPINHLAIDFAMGLSGTVVEGICIPGLPIKRSIFVDAVAKPFVFNLPGEILSNEYKRLETQFREVRAQYKATYGE